jgi:hypothetical protein
MLFARNARVVRRALFSSSSHQDVQEVIKGLVIPPRKVFGDIVVPAVETLMWFASSNESREKFVDMVNKGVINIELLGIPMSLALFNGLNSPLLEKYNFNPVDFGTGVKVALQHYHDTQNSMQESICRWAEQHPPSIKDNTDQTNKLMNYYIKDNISSGPIMEKVREEQKKDPDSPFVSMEQMVTPEYFQNMCASMIKDTVLFQVMNINYKDWKTEIGNVSLLKRKCM